LTDNPTAPENIFNDDEMQNPIEYRYCHFHTKTCLTNNLNANYEKVTLDGISLIREKYFVPISSSIHL
jgi:hypothetical protein